MKLSEQLLNLDFKEFQDEVVNPWEKENFQDGFCYAKIHAAHLVMKLEEYIETLEEYVDTMKCRDTLLTSLLEKLDREIGDPQYLGSPRQEEVREAISVNQFKEKGVRVYGQR